MSRLSDVDRRVEQLEADLHKVSRILLQRNLMIWEFINDLLKVDTEATAEVIQRIVALEAHHEKVVSNQELKERMKNYTMDLNLIDDAVTNVTHRVDHIEHKTGIGPICGELEDGA